MLWGGGGGVLSSVSLCLPLSSSMTDAAFSVTGISSRGSFSRSSKSVTLSSILFDTLSASSK